MDMEMIEGQVTAAEAVGDGAFAATAMPVLERLIDAIGALERSLERMGAERARAAEVRANGAEDARRKTVPHVVTHLLTKQGVSLEALGGEGLQAGVLDAALGSLSVEQRIAVKAQLMRAGMLE